MLNINSFSKELVEGLVGVLKDQAISIILYGSVARGTETDESDIDIAVIINGFLTVDVEDKLSDFVVDLNLKYDRVFSVIDIQRSDFERLSKVSPFYKNVEKEGIVLWKAA